MMMNLWVMLYLTKRLHEIARKKLKNLKILKKILIFEVKIYPNKTYLINNKNYYFKKIIISIGKNTVSNKNHKKYYFEQDIILMLVFLNIKKIIIIRHMSFSQTDGPLAVLPSPSSNKKKSTFIYSSKEKINISIKKLLYK